MTEPSHQQLTITKFTTHSHTHTHTHACIEKKYHHAHKPQIRKNETLNNKCEMSLSMW